MFAWCNAGPLEAEHQRRVSSGEFGIGTILDGLNKDGAAVNVHHDHYVFVARLGALGKLACLVGKNGVAYMVYLGVDILDFAPPELSRMPLFEGCRFGFGGAYVLARLVEVSFGCLNSVGVVLLDVFGG